MAVSNPSAAGCTCSPNREILDVDLGQVAFIRSIGSGTFANVYLAEWRGQQVAVKQYTQAQHMPFFEAETRQLARACHPNIIALYAKSTEQRVLIMEYSPVGALDSIIDNLHKYDYTAAHAISWARQAADGIAHLHKINVLHRDLKPANMLLFREGQDLKLTDFGTSCLQRTYLTSDRGSPAWMAPEVWHTNDYNERCDVYSWAICFWQIMSRQQPFHGCTMYQVMWKVINGDRLPMLKSCPTIIRSMIVDCWDGDKARRPAMSDVARKMAILQKLYPGYQEPITVHTFANDQEVDSLPAQDLQNVESTSSFETVSGSLNSGESLLRSDLGSLAVVNSNRNGNNMVHTLTPGATVEPGRRVSSANSALRLADTPPPVNVSPPELPIRPSASESNIANRQLPAQPQLQQLPLRPDLNSSVSKLIFDHHIELQKAFNAAQEKHTHLTQLKLEMSGDLDQIRTAEREANNRVRAYQDLSTENESLASLVTYFENNQHQQ